MTKTHYVVKRQRGGRGWINLPATGYPSEAEAIEMAKDFAADQCASGIVGTEIWVREGRRGREVVTFRWGDGALRMVDWR